MQSQGLSAGFSAFCGMAGQVNAAGGNWLWAARRWHLQGQQKRVVWNQPGLGSNSSPARRAQANPFTGLVRSFLTYEMDLPPSGSCRVCLGRPWMG